MNKKLTDIDKPENSTNAERKEAVGLSCLLYGISNFNCIHNEDILSFLSKIPDNTFNFAFSDPPYNKNKDYGVYKDNLPQEQYLNWVKDFISEYRRVSNNNFGMFVGADLLKTYWDLMPNAKLIIVRKGAIGTPFKDYYRQYSGFLCTAKPNQTIYDLWWDIKMPGEGYFFREERFPHPGLTSLKLTQRILNYFTKENDLVFDGFMGTGTTAVACVHLNRKYIGTEINLNYINISEARLKSYYTQIKLAI